ncbi:MAG TPA: hypothetical protein DCE47_09240 [Planctomycetaceae bacterium]|nr:hypothetical protein [Planctomycetaceae bacterium]
MTSVIQATWKWPAVSWIPRTAASPSRREDDPVSSHFHAAQTASGSQQAVAATHPRSAPVTKKPWPAKTTPTSRLAHGPSPKPTAHNRAKTAAASVCNTSSTVHAVAGESRR